MPFLSEGTNGPQPPQNPAWVSVGIDDDAVDDGDDEDDFLLHSFLIHAFRLIWLGKGAIPSSCTLDSTGDIIELEPDL